jgi:sentrin-specific protease 1
MRTYLAEEATDKKKKHIDLRGWRDVFSDESPQQENGYDCGVFAAQTLEQISRRDPHTPIPLDPPTIPWMSDDIETDAGRMKITSVDDAEDDDDDVDEYEWNFGQENMPYLRRRMVYEIASQRLLD